MTDTLSSSSGRISQLLPTVKCSNCTQLVELTELSNHQCAPIPAVPKLKLDIPKPSSTAANLLPVRLQGSPSPVTKSAVQDRRPNPPPSASSSDSQRSSTRSNFAPVRVSNQPINPNAIPPNSPRAMRRPGPSPSPLSRQDTNASSAPPQPSTQHLRLSKVRTPSITSGNMIGSPRRPSLSSSIASGTSSSSSSSPSSPVGLPPTVRPRQGSRSSNSSLLPQRLQSHPQQQQQTPPQTSPDRPSSQRPSEPPRIADHATEPDTKIGGAAGMAGIGRRGFAAAARAAMFVTPGPSGQGQGVRNEQQNGEWQPHIPGNADRNANFDQHSPIGMDGRRANAPRFLDISTDGNSMATGSSTILNAYTPTPPLTPNSGGSKSPSSLSPHSPFDSPSVMSDMVPGLTTPRAEDTPTGISSLRLPFFDKFRAKLPGATPTPTTATFPVSITTDVYETIAKPDTFNTNTTTTNSSSPTSTNPNNPITPSTARQSVSSQDRSSMSSTSSGSSYAASIADETACMSNSGAQNRHSRSPSSDSEYGGLAYADSEEEDESEPDQRASAISVHSRKPPAAVSFALPSSILRTNSESTIVRAEGTTSQVRFPSSDEESDSELQPSLTRAGRPAILKSAGSISSMSSKSSAEDIAARNLRYSSESSATSFSRRSSITTKPAAESIPISDSPSSTGDRGPMLVRSNSERIAHALGLSRTPPSAYSRLGGPGIGGGSGSRRGSAASSLKGGNDKSGSFTSESRVTNGATAAPLLSEDSQGLSKSKSLNNTSGPSSSNLAPTRGVAQRSNTVQGIPTHPPDSSDDIIDTSTPVAVTRSHTTPKLNKDLERESLRPSSENHDAGALQAPRKRKSRQCVRCEKKIIDGRWVQVDGGGVLCEHCWKNMYLPKCRRCNLVIEKQAVSSSDGQLKGKYHRDCFNCHTCHKPFPDKTFYVYDGLAFCCYHYHERNDSLCAAALCGQPIEGACAVSHTGDRYHPHHLVCDYPQCTQTLEEYWEVDGRMLCERHQRRAMDDDDQDWAPSAKALKRVTRFIDLAGGGGGVGGVGNAMDNQSIGENGLR